MTDNDIITDDKLIMDLEFWIKLSERCDVPPFVTPVFLQCILDLINRHKAEIERLNKEVDRLSQCVLYHDGEIVDAIKDFVGELKEECFDDWSDEGTTETIHIRSVIDDFVKEKIGENRCD